MLLEHDSRKGMTQRSFMWSKILRFRLCSLVEVEGWVLPGWRSCGELVDPVRLGGGGAAG